METLSPRKLLKGAFEHIWDRLTQSKTLTLKELQDEPKVWKQGAIIFAFFDRLDYVDAVQYPLLTLRLKERGV